MEAIALNSLLEVGVGVALALGLYKDLQTRIKEFVTSQVDDLEAMVEANLPYLTGPNREKIELEKKTVQEEFNDQLDEAMVLGQRMSLGAALACILSLVATTTFPSAGLPAYSAVLTTLGMFLPLFATLARFWLIVGQTRQELKVLFQKADTVNEFAAFDQENGLESSN